MSKVRLAQPRLAGARQLLIITRHQYRISCVPFQVELKPVWQPSCTPDAAADLGSGKVLLQQLEAALIGLLGGRHCLE